MAAQQTLAAADAKTFEDAYKNARAYIEAGVINEKDTLDSVLQLAMDKAGVGVYVAQMKKSVDAVGAAELAALQTSMESAAKALSVKPVALVLSDAEKAAMKVIPKPTAKITQNGYQGYRDFINQVPQDTRAKYPYAAEVPNTSELQLLVNGKHSVLDIKKLLDAQSTRKSTLQGITNYLQILKLAGLVEF